MKCLIMLVMYHYRHMNDCKETIILKLSLSTIGDRSAEECVPKVWSRLVCCTLRRLAHNIWKRHHRGRAKFWVQECAWRNFRCGFAPFNWRMPKGVLLSVLYVISIYIDTGVGAIGAHDPTANVWTAFITFILVSVLGLFHTHILLLTP